MFRPSKNSIQVNALLAEALAAVQVTKKDFTKEQFAAEAKERMAKLKLLTLEELQKKPSYINLMTSVSDKPLIIGSGPIMDAYKGFHEEKRKKNSLHTWPEAYYPELTGNKYDLEENIAFIFAGIAKGKTFEIVTPLDLLIKRAANEFYSSDLGGAFVEIIWLLKNDYQLKVENGKILATTAAKIAEMTLPTMTQKFFSPKEAIAAMEKIAAIWHDQFSATEVENVKLNWATQLLNYAPNVTQKNREKPAFLAQMTEANDIVKKQCAEYVRTHTVSS